MGKFRIYVESSQPREPGKTLNKVFFDSHDGEAEAFGALPLIVHEDLTEVLARLDIPTDNILVRAVASLAVRRTFEILKKQGALKKK